MIRRFITLAIIALILLCCSTVQGEPMKLPSWQTKLDQWENARGDGADYIPALDDEGYADDPGVVKRRDEQTRREMHRIKLVAPVVVVPVIIIVTPRRTK